MIETHYQVITVDGKETGIAYFPEVDVYRNPASSEMSGSLAGLMKGKPILLLALQGKREISNEQFISYIPKLSKLQVLWLRVLSWLGGLVG